MSARLVYGKNSVKAILDANPDHVYKVFLAEGMKPDKRVQAIHDAARNHRIPVQSVPRQKLDQMIRGNETKSEEPVIHQGVVASVAAKPLLNLPELIARCKEKIAAGGHPRLLMLDGVTDPRNFGAILRVADAAGLDGVIVPKHHSAGFGPAVAKTASGAEETVTIATVSNLNNAITQLKDAGFWIAGAAHAPRAVDYYLQDYKMPMVLIMGSEDQGLGQLITKNCDFLVKIPMHGTVESLNVATAAAVLLFEMVKK